jgi:thiol:disulfide interchange protein DsbD
MKKALLLLVIFMFFVQWHFNAQVEDPVKWTYTLKPLPNNEALLIFDAKIESKWLLYSQFFPDGGPVRLSFTFKQSKDYQCLGKVEENPKPKVKFDDVFEIEVKYFEKIASFTQKIKILSKKDFIVKVEVEGQACNDMDGRCIPLNPDFEFKVKGSVK